MDTINRMYKRKKFFKMIFPTIGEGEFYRIFQTKQNFSKVEFFNDIDDMNDYIERNRFNWNTYFSLSTTNGIGGTEKDIITRNVIAFDFDKKDFDKLDSKDIMYKFKELGLWYHALIDSGNGYHAHMCIEPTINIQKVIDVTKAIGNKLGADINAMKSTQVLRVPYTFNIKENKSKQVNIITQFDKGTIKRYNIDKLYNRFCNEKYNNSIGDKATTYIINNSNIKACIVNILEHGSAEGNRNNDLQKIVVTLRRLNKNIKEIQYTCQEWNNKNEKQLSDHELEYQVSYIFENVDKCSYECKGCKYANECWNKIESDFEYSEGEELITMKEGHTRSLKYSNRRGAKVMESNDLLIYCILKNNIDGLYRDEIIQEMTYKKKCRFSKNTLSKALNDLEQNDFIEVTIVDRKKMYKVKDIRSKVELTYNISYSATYECVKGNITVDEFKLYNYMRYLHNKQQRENPNSLKGNLFQFNQIDIAKDLGVTQGRISQMINNLLEEKILGIWYRQKSKNNGFEYNIYRLNY